MRESRICWVRMIAVIAAIPSAASVQPCSCHWRWASAIGSNASGFDMLSPFIDRHPAGRLLTQAGTASVPMIF